MKKQHFMIGTFIATSGILISRILGAIYTIPLNKMLVGDAGLVYGYAYTIYFFMLNFSIVGFPYGISKLVAHYNSLGAFKTSAQIKKLSTRLMFALGVGSFLITFIFANLIAYTMVPASDHALLNQVANAIRALSFSLLIIPVLGSYRGYTQGFQNMIPTSTSQVLEQIFRVAFLLSSVYVLTYVLDKPNLAVYFAVFATFIGGIAGFFYFKFYLRKDKIMLEELKLTDRTNIRIPRDVLVKKIISFSIPFILLGVIVSFYIFVDAFTILKTYDNLKYDVVLSKQVVQIYTVWVQKLDTIILSFTTGFAVSLVPYITDSYAKKDYDDVKLNINKAISALIFLSIPLTTGAIILAPEIYYTFYGTNDVLNANDQWIPGFLFQISLFTLIFFSFFNLINALMQATNNKKAAIRNIFYGLIVKVATTVPLMYVFHYFFKFPIAGAVLGTVLGYGTSSIAALYFLRKKFKVNFKAFFMSFIKTVGATIVLVIIVLLLKRFLNFNMGTIYHYEKDIIMIDKGKLLVLGYVLLLGLVGGFVYFAIMYKLKVMHFILPESMISKIDNLFKKGGKEND